MKRTKKAHFSRMSKCRPKPAFVPACNDHEQKYDQKKCHKGKIEPPIPESMM